MKFGFSSLLALFAFFATASAVPTVVLNFDWNDQSVILYGTILLVYLWVFADHSGWSVNTNSLKMAALKVEHGKNWGGIFDKISSWIPGLIKLALQITMVVVFAGFLLDRFEDAAGNPVAITETWKTVIVILVAAALRLDLFAAQLYNRLNWFGPAAFIAFLEWLAWGGAVGFLIAEELQLPTGVDVIWQTILAIGSGLYFLVTTYYFLLYLFAAIYAPATPEGEYQELMSNEKKLHY